MFVLMIPNAQEGDQDSFGTEVWAVDVRERRVLSRSTIASANGRLCSFAYARAFANDNEAKPGACRGQNPVTRCIRTSGWS
jgi:hypothetical protein